MKTNRLIELLVKETGSLKRLAPPGWRFVAWFVISFLILLCGIYWFGLREDLKQALSQPTFVWSSVFIFMIAAVSAFSAFLLSIPDQKKIWLKIFPVAAVLLWLATIVTDYSKVESFYGGLGVSCIKNIIILGFFPGILLFVMLRKALPLEILTVGVLAMLSAMSLGALGVQFICLHDDFLHVFLWHFIPVVVLGISGVWLGLFLFRR